MSTEKSRKERAAKDADVYRDAPLFRNKFLKFSVTIPPSINHMYIPTRRGGKILTQNAQEFIRNSRARINLAIEEQLWIKQDTAVWMYADMVVYMPDRRIRDSHNMLKILMDVMQDVVFVNDYYVMPRIQSVEYDSDNPRVEVCIRIQEARERERARQIVAM